jgi:hypothetical protein
MTASITTIPRRGMPAGGLHAVREPRDPPAGEIDDDEPSDARARDVEPHAHRSSDRARPGRPQPQIVRGLGLGADVGRLGAETRARGGEVRDRGLAGGLEARQAEAVTAPDRRAHDVARAHGVAVLRVPVVAQLVRNDRDRSA